MSKWSQRARAHFTAMPIVDAPETPKTPLSGVMGCEYQGAPENHVSLSVVLGVPLPPVSENIDLAYAANEETVPVLTEADTDALEERAAILEFDAGMARHAAERAAHLLLLKSKGVAHAEAKELASLLPSRDGRHLCFECKHLHGFGHWRCGNALQADVSVSVRMASLSKGLTHQLQRCPGFKAYSNEEIDQ